MCRRVVRGAWVARALLAASVSLGAGGCTTLDNAIGSIPWFTTMRDQVAVRPFEPPVLSPPAGSVPTWGREDSLDIFTDLLDVANPVPRTAASVERGRRVYDTYCAVCHGGRGGGDGTVAGKLGYVPPLTSDMSRQRSEGYLYAMIKQGRGLMPRYGDKIRGADRWHVVNYVRQLQGEAGSGQ
jgi:mono/diheme cytochrome c family protein